MDSEVVLLIHRNEQKYPNVLDQLDYEFDKAKPDMFICTKPVWIEIELALSKKLKVQDKKYHMRGYDRVTATTPKGTVTLPKNGGFNAILYRSRPVVAMDAGDDNIIAARLKGGMDV